MMNDVGINVFAEDGAAGSSGARFHDGKTWTGVVAEKMDPVEPPKKKKNPLSFIRRSFSSTSKIDKTPVPPVLNGDGKILVTIPSFRGTHGTALHYTEFHCTLLGLAVHANRYDMI